MGLACDPFSMSPSSGGWRGENKGYLFDQVARTVDLLRTKYL